MVITSHHTQACFNAWINCENLLAELAQLKITISKKIMKVVDECAYICMGTFHAMKSRSVNISRFAVLCVGICEECAEICERENRTELLECAKICRACSASISALAASNFD